VATKIPDGLLEKIMRLRFSGSKAAKLRDLAAAVALAVVLATVAPLAAQEEDEDVFEGLVEVSEVLIDVLATDDEGHVVRA
jgi:hypothetical protein